MSKIQIQKAGNCSELYTAGRDIIIHNNYEEKDKENFYIPLFFSREDAFNHLQPYFRENKMIFDTYGPNTDERFNPESEYAEQWIIKIKDKIIPNNRYILKCIESNSNLLHPSEFDTLDKFIQHIHDFEMKHTGKSTFNGLMFPADIVNIFGEV